MTALVRVVRAAVALTALVAIGLGLPLALMSWGTMPWRGAFSVASLRDVLAEPGADRVIAGVLTIAAWGVWILFLRAIVLEAAAARRARAGGVVERRPGPLRSPARGLVLWLSMTAGTLSSVPGAGAAAPPLTDMLTAEVTAAPAAAEAPPVAVAEPAEELDAADTPVLVEERTTAWAFAEAHLGDGLRWQDLWTLNRDRPQPDDQAWTDSEDDLQPGWQMLVPVGTGRPAPSAEPGSAPAPAPVAAPAVVEVTAGDHFWQLAESQLATTWGRPVTEDEVRAYWEVLVDTNRDRLAPPGDPDLIHPGEVFVTPDPGPDPTRPPAEVPAPAPAPEPSVEVAPPAQPDGPDRPAAPAETGATDGAVSSTAPAEPPAPPARPAPVDDEAAPDIAEQQPSSTPPSSTVAPAPDGPIQEDGQAAEPIPQAPAGPAPEGEAAPATGSVSSDVTQMSTEVGDDESSVPLRPVGLTGGGVCLAGVVLLLDRRRRAQQRHRPRGMRVPGLPAPLERAESRLRTGVDVPAARLVDAALRAAAAGSGAMGLPGLRWVEVADDTVVVVLAVDAAPPRGFVADGPGRWRNAAGHDELERLGARAASPAPTLVPVGFTDAGAELLVELESSGVVTVSGPEATATAFLRGLAVASTTVPWNIQPQVLLAGMTGELCALPWVSPAPSLGEALSAAEAHASRVAASLRSLDCDSTGQARAAGATPDSWDPLVVISAVAPHDLDGHRLAALAARPQHAVAVVTPPGAPAPAGRSFTLDSEGGLRIDGVDVAVRARLLAEDDARVVVEMLDRAADLDAAVPADEVVVDDVRGAPARTAPPAEPLSVLTSASEHVDAPPAGQEVLDGLLADVEVVVRVLGEVGVVRLSPDGGEDPLAIGRQKGLEALTYLALRESAVDVEDLQIALYPDGANSMKTVHNAVSAARAVVGASLFPNASGGRYELSERVTTDYGVFCELLERAEEIDAAEAAADVLEVALGLVRGEPFLGAGRGYGWVAQHRGMIVAQVVDAAEELAEVRLATGDWRAAEWAARQGLLVFPADERMYRLLMRTAKAAGNSPGVQRAFRELCAVLADPDDGVEPVDTVHPETLELLDELTGGRRRPA